MKRLLLWVGMVGIGLVGLTGQAAAAVIALWEFDEGSGTSAADSSGNNWTGTLVNFGTPPPINPTPPDPGWITTASWRGLRFNKKFTEAARVTTTLPIFQQLRNKSFTLEFIASADTISHGGPMFGQSGNTLFFFGRTNPSPDYVPLSLNYNFSGLANGYSNTINNILDGKMHHFALVFDDIANTMQFYVDYQPAGRVTGVSGVLENYTETLWLGSTGYSPLGNTGTAMWMRCGYRTKR